MFPPFDSSSLTLPCVLDSAVAVQTEGTTTKLLAILVIAAIPAGMMVPRTASAQNAELVLASAPSVHSSALIGCLTCTSSVSNGTLTCSVSFASGAGYNTCSCPCSCSGYCSGPKASAPTMDLKARDGSVEIPKSGVIVAGLTAPVAERRFTQGEFRGWSGNARVYFASNYGVMSYADGSFKAFPLETSNSFVVTNCAGSFVARAHRVAAAPSRVADVLRELNGVSAN